MFAQKQNVDSDVQPGESGLNALVTNEPLNSLNYKVLQYRMENCANKNLTVLTSDVNAEPDSSVSYSEDDSVYSTSKKSVKGQYDTIKLESLRPDSVGVDEGAVTIETVPVSPVLDGKSNRLETVSDLGNSDVCNYVKSLRSTCNVISEPIETSIIQNVSKLTKNFTLNVNSDVNSISNVQDTQNISNGNQTLWLPAIIASGNVADAEEQTYEDESEPPPATLSQMYLTSAGQHLSSVSAPVNSKPSHISSNKYSPKVQILGSITIPKSSTMAVTTSQSNVKMHGNYLNQNDMASINSSVITSPSKQIISNAVLHPANLSARQANQVQVKCSSVINSVNLQMKGMPTGNINRSFNKISNMGGKIETSTTSTIISGQNNHVLSRVLPNTKISLQPTGRVMKSSNIQYNAKPVGNPDIQQTPNIVHTHKIQSSVPVKIIQQQTLQPSQKSGFKTVASRPTIGASKNVAYNSVNSVPSRSWVPTSNLNTVINQKQAPSFAKNISGVVNVQKLNCKSVPQKMVVHQPTNQVLMQNSNQLNRINAQHYQPNETSGGIRYIQNYVGLDNNTSTTSSKQNLTAQILQSLSQPKIVFPPQHISTSKRSNMTSRHVPDDSYYYHKPNEQNRQIHGDPYAILTTENIPIQEERPSLPDDDSLSSHYQALQLVMLDHTYALQTIPSNQINGANPVANSSSPVNNVAIPPTSPIKVVTVRSNSPVNGAITVQSPVSSMSVIIPSNPPTIIQNTVSQPTYQYNIPPPEDDDTASIISSIEGDRDMERSNDRHDSDTETAPEGEEEGKTRCVCEFTHDDGYMICCDRCGEWQHVDCMGIDRQNIPDDYMCDRCEPRLIDRKRARSIQLRKREEITGLGSSASDSSSGGSLDQKRNKQILLGVSTSSTKKRPLTVTTYSNTISGVSRTVPTFSSFSPPYDAPPSPQSQTKRGLKRPRRLDNVRKGPKRKIPEKRKRKNSETPTYRSKYCALSTSTNQVNQWTDSFELAMTNHYSPQLRAKIARYYSNKGGSDMTNISAILNAYLCTTVPHAGGKILITTKDLKDSVPIVELRGKYMLSTQHKPQPQLSGRVGSQKPGPFLFFYRLPEDSTEICIDTRTYGNEARFVRRSCKPNAELQHCIYKGVLHVYLVTIAGIQSNTEITICHESNSGTQPCACGNPKFCKQNRSSSPLVHKNNGAAFDIPCDKKGRTRNSSSLSLEHVSSSHIKYEDAPKITSTSDIVKQRVSESEADNEPSKVVVPPEKLEDVKPPIETLIPKLENIPPVEEDIKPKIEEELPIKKSNSSSKIEPDIKPVVKEEVKTEEECPSTTSNQEKLPPDDEDDDDDDDDEPLSKIECKTANQVTNKATNNAPSKNKEEKPKKGSTSRRTSTHSTRTTRASTQVSQSTNESADEKSDSQSDSKTPQVNKEKKKMTREERKMEAIMKAFERMEKAELRKQENRDRQTKRRESDSHPSNVSNDKDNDDNDDGDAGTVKRKRRKKGRVRTTSQNNQRNRNRLNSIDSDMVTSGEESTSLLSPANSSNITASDNFPETGNMASSEDLTNYQDHSDTLSSPQPVQRLSSACLLVEAAVGPLESTFKFPKTKKDIMNEWLSKSPERHLTYDINHSLDYNNTNDNNNTTPHPYINNKAISREISLEYLMKGAGNMAGNMNLESSPDKNSSGEQMDAENLSYSNMMDSICNQNIITSPYLLQKQKKAQNDCYDMNMCDKKVLKNRYRKGYRGALGERSSPAKRTLRSNTNTENTGDSNVNYDNFTPIHNDKVIAPITPEIRDTEIAIVPQPPQHSAKKRWLRQAISEESDSPTAESPPNEMVTPLKKRRLARESLTLEPPFSNCDELQLNTVNTPVKTENVFPKISTEDNLKLSLPPKMEVINEESNSSPAEPVELKANVLENNDENVLNALAQEIDHNNDKYFPDTVSESTKESNDNDEESKGSQICNDTPTEKEIKSEIAILSDLKINFTNFSRLKRSKDYLDSKDDACIEDVIGVNKESKETCSREIKSEPVSNIHSAETSGNSSPVIDDIDDIKKRIHTFHAENILMLKTRNRKQPKEKRKVNLNFDLCVLENQTVGVKLKSENDMKEVELKVSIPESPNIDQSKCVTDLIADLVSPKKIDSPIGQDLKNRFVTAPLTLFPANNAPSVDSDKGFMCTPLFSGNFKGDAVTSPMPDINVIKNAINKTTALDIGFKTSTNDEYKNVQEILSHVNQMDSHNSLLLSGVLRDSNHTANDGANSNKLSTPRLNDPRLNPPPVEKPKPQRRKLSITEYRRRHSMLSNSSTEQEASSDSNQPSTVLPVESPTLSQSSITSDDRCNMLQNSTSSDTQEPLTFSGFDKDSSRNSSSENSPVKSLSQCEAKMSSAATDTQVISQAVNSIFNNTSPQIRSAR